MEKLLVLLLLCACSASGSNWNLLAPENEFARGLGAICFNDNECIAELRCVDQICQDPCEVSPCGKHTECSVKEHKQQCVCKEGFNGDAIKGCNPDEETACRRNVNCPWDEECVEGDCVKVCDSITCGENAACIPKDHEGKCVCHSGSTGDPYKGCSRIDIGIISCTKQQHCPEDKMCFQLKCVDPCDVQCGPNTDCVVKDHEATCSCQEGFKGDPTSGCIEDEGGCDDLECRGNDHCDFEYSCIENKCQDPCDGFCGDNTLCSVNNHIPSCECVKGFTGNPFIGCKSQGGGGGGGDGGQGGGDGGDGEGKGGEGTGSGCVGSWPPAKGGKKKFVIDTSKTIDWNGAYMQCYSRGHRLATIDTVAEYEDLNKQLQAAARNKGFWIGGIGRGNDQVEWIWMATEQKINPKVVRWTTNSPDKYGRYHCLELNEVGKRGYNWNDRPCNSERLVVCEHYD